MILMKPEIMITPLQHEGLGNVEDEGHQKHKAGVLSLGLEACAWATSYRALHHRDEVFETETASRVLFDVSAALAGGREFAGIERNESR